MGTRIPATSAYTVGTSGRSLMYSTVKPKFVSVDPLSGDTVPFTSVFSARAAWGATRLARRMANPRTDELMGARMRLFDPNTAAATTRRDTDLPCHGTNDQPNRCHSMFYPWCGNSALETPP